MTDMNVKALGEDTSPVPDYLKLLSLKDRVFVVLGAGQGIGRQAAHALSQAGATVVCVGRRADATEAIASEIGGTAIVADATVRADVQRLAGEVMARHGRLDGVVDILGMPRVKPLSEFTDEDWDWQFDVGLRHVFLATQLLAPLVGRSGGGPIVFVGSAAGKLSTFNQTAYGAAKAAMHQFAQAAAIEYGPLGVRVNVVSPALVTTPRVRGTRTADDLQQAAHFYPMGKVGTPPEIASVILFLACDMSSHVSGQTLYADGGMSGRYPLYDVAAAKSAADARAKAKA